MPETKTYDILQLQKLSIIELTSIADQFEVQIQNGFKQGLIYAILNHQASSLAEPVEAKHKPSEFHSRDRYAMSDQITESKSFEPGLHHYSTKL